MSFQGSAENVKEEIIWHSEFFGRADKCEPSLGNEKSCKIPSMQLQGVMKKKHLRRSVA